MFLIFLKHEAYSENSAENQNTQLKTLETVNSFRGQWCCINDGYIYGVGTDYTTVLRKTETGQSYQTRGSVTSVDPSFMIQYKMFPTSIPGMIFVLVKNNSGHYLLKTRNGGATFTNVYTFGEGNGAEGSNNTEVRLLRDILELTTEIPGGGGVGTLYMGEYNVSTTRIRGSTNDRVRIMKSENYGDSWTQVAEWNTNGQNQIGHVHAMKQDPYSGEIYICVGDANEKTGIIKWDGASPWEDNSTLAEIGTMDGFTVISGRQRYRVCDVLFDENYFYTFADTQKPNNPSGSESGIWRGKKDFSSYTRVNNNIFDYDPMHIGWFGGKVGNTFVFTTAREYINPENAWKELNTQVYISNDGLNWHASGVLNWRDLNNPTLPRYINNVFASKNKLYIDCVAGAGHYSLIQCEMAKTWKTLEDPIILHPVYFVGTWYSAGDDANSGTTPDAPKRTLNNILTSNRISAGARVRVASGNFQETNIRPQWSEAGLQGRGSVVIEGQGMKETHIIRSSGSGNSYGIFVEAERTLTNANTPLIIKDLEFYLTVEGEGNHSNYVIYNNDSYIKTIGCKIGNINNDDSPLIRLNREGSKYSSENSIHVAGSGTSIYKSIVQPGAANTSYHFINCIILNAYNAFSNNYPGINFSLKHCILYGIENTGVLFETNWNGIPVIKNCIFLCGSSPISDLTGLSVKDIDYNFYNTPISNHLDGGNSLTLDDPLLVDPENGDFSLSQNSPCNNRGIYLVDVLIDFFSRARKNPPSMGPFENFTVTRTGYIRTMPKRPFLRVYPNPVSGILNIEYRNDRVKTISIISSAGVVLTQEKALFPVQQIDLTEYAKGLYILECIKHDGRLERVKIINY